MNTTNSRAVLFGMALLSSIFLMVYSSKAWMLIVDLLIGFAIPIYVKQSSRRFWGWLFMSFIVTAFHIFIFYCYDAYLKPDDFGQFFVDTTLEDVPSGLPFGMVASGIGMIFSQAYKNRKSKNEDQANAA